MSAATLPAGVIPVWPHTEADILAGSRTDSYRFQILDGPAETPKGYLRVLPGWLLDMAANEDTKDSGSVTVERDASVNWDTARVRITYSVEGVAEEWPVAVMLPVFADESWTGTGATLPLTLLDKVTVLSNAAISSTWSLAVGVSVTDAVVELIAGAGVPLSQIQIEPSAQTLAAAKSYPQGTPRLTIIADLLSAIDYFALTTDPRGVFIAMPYALPSARPVEFTLADQPGTERYTNTFTVSTSRASVYNQVTVTNAPSGDDDPLMVTVINDDPASEFAQSKIGVRAADTITAPDVLTSPALLAYAQRELAIVGVPTTTTKVGHRPVKGWAPNKVARWRSVRAGRDVACAVSQIHIEAALATSTLTFVVA